MFKHTLLTLTVCAIASLSISQAAYAQISEFKILLTDGAERDFFGGSVSISGDYAVVGATGDDDNGSSSGSAYVFKRAGTSWVQEAKLLASDGAAADFLGGSVSISGDYAVVGATGDDDNGSASGSAYVFKRAGTSWAQEAKLLASDGAAVDQFGLSVSISGDYALVGAIRDDDNGSGSGSAYVFKRTGTSWAQEAKLLPSDGAAQDRFGSSVSISGDYAVVGAIWDDDNGDNSGSAYVFKRSGTSWVQEAKLLASDGAAEDIFGYSVSISGDYAVVGALWHDDNGDNSGSAYLFKRSGTSWVQEAKLLASDGAAGDEFGHSVSISGDHALVGAAHDQSGSVYLFQHIGISWVEKTKLLPSDGAAGDHFGGSVSISGDYALVGANEDDDNGNSSGSAYMYHVSGPPFVTNPIMDVVADEDFGSISVALLDDVFGDPDLPNDSLRYMFSISSGVITGSISGDTLWLFSVADSNGMTEVVVTATDDSSKSVSDSFNVIIVPVGADPASFSLAFPSGDTLNTLLPAFSWHTTVDPGFGDPTVYILRISAFETLLSPINTETVSDTSFTLSVPLADDSLYFWSVIAFDSSGGFAVSDTSSFLLDKQESPLEFSLISPVDNSSVDSLRPVFRWFATEDPDPRDVVKYTLIVLSGPDTVYMSASIEDTAHQVSGDIPVGSYQWFVVAKDADDDGLDRPSSEVFRFGIIVRIDNEFKITASDGAADDNFGHSVSISGDYSVVGAWDDDDNGDRSGSAYMFKLSGTSWAQEVKLLPSDGTASDIFGSSVSISGDYAVVGAPHDDDNGDRSGSAYVFKRTGTFWFQEAKLLASDGAAQDRFGRSVSISGDYAVLGAWLDTDNGTDAGSAYVFKRSGTSWAQEWKLLPFDGAAGDNFGLSVSISGDYAVVGAFLDDDNGSGSGSAYVFKRTGTFWFQEAKLLASDGTADDFFGFSVSISGDYAVVGAAGDDDNGSGSGSAYVFKRTGTSWAQEAKLLASDGTEFDGFGRSVSISGDNAVVGAAGDNDNGDRSGSAYIFKRTGTSWTQEVKLLASDGAASDLYGTSVSISGDYAVVGASWDDDNGDGSGSAYLYTGFATAVGVENEMAGLPAQFALSQNYPNPFNPETVIEYALPKASDISLVIYNLRGQEVRRWDIQGQTAGYHTVTWNASSVASGVYLYRLQAGDYIETRKMVLLK